jgi:anti-sigma factor RsiW
MDCEKYRLWISRKADGELEIEETGLLDAHVASCPECEAYEKDIESLRALIQADEGSESSSDLTMRIVAAARAEGLIKPNGILLALKRLCAAAAIFAAVTVALFYSGSSGTVHADDREVHYEDLFQRTGPGDGDVLEALIKTDNPIEAIRIHSSSRRP